MIVKTKSIKNPKGFKTLLNYMLFDEDRLYDDNNRSFLITHNVRGESLDELVASFEENEQYRQRKRKDSVYIYHEMLSFHRGDAEHLSLKKLEDIGRQWVRLRNPKGLYVIAPHFDKEHYHLHIAASGITFREGKANRLSKQSFSELKKHIQQYQVEKYPELSKSVVEHGRKGKSRVTDKEYQMKQRGKLTQKEQLIETLEKCYGQANSKKDFYKRVEAQGLKIYSRNGDITGVWCGKRKYRFRRLGFTSEQIQELEIRQQRKNELRKLQRHKEQGREKKKSNREYSE